MLDSVVSKVVVGVVAVTAPVIQEINDCGHTKNITTNGPLIQIVGPNDVAFGAPATYKIGEVGLGPGQKCPQQLTWSFSGDAAVPDNHTIVIKAPPTHKNADGDCVTAPMEQTFTWHVATAASLGFVEVEASADVTIRAQGRREVKVRPATPPPPPPPPAPVTTPTVAFNASVSYAASGHVRGVAIARDPTTSAPEAVAAAVDRDSGVDAVEVRNINLGMTLDFPDVVDLPAGSNPSSIVSADFDRDGLPDFAVGAKPGGAGEVTILRSRPAGGYDLLHFPLQPGDAPSALAVGKFNGDAFADIAVGGALGLSVLTNVGSAAVFGPANLVNPGGAPAYGVATGDLDGDARTDLIGSLVDQVPGNTLDAIVSRRSATSPGDVPAFDLPQDKVGAWTGKVPLAVAAHDVDGDGHLDLVAANHTLDSLSVLFGSDGSGAGYTEKLLPGPISPASVAAGDVNGDGVADVASGDYSGADASVFLGSGARGFAARVSVPMAFGVQSVALADITSDGRADLIVGTYGPQSGGDGAVMTATVVPPARRRRASAATTRAAAQAKTKAVVLNATGGSSLALTKKGTPSYGADGSGRLKGATLIGQIAGKIASKTQRKKAPRAVLDLLAATFSGKANITRVIDAGRGNPVFGDGYLLGRSKAKGKKTLLGCVRIKRSADRKTMTAKLVGATGALRTARITGVLPPLSIDTPTKGRVLLTVTKSTKKLGMPKACKALIKSLPTAPKGK